MESEVRVILTGRPKYAAPDGTVREATFVTLRAPSGGAYRVAAAIKQQIVRAMVDADVEQADAPPPVAPVPGAKPARPSAAQMLVMLAGSTADFPAILDNVRTLMVEHGVALLDGEVVVNRVLVDALSLEDFNAICGEYLAVFPLA